MLLSALQIKNREVFSYIFIRVLGTRTIYFYFCDRASHKVFPITLIRVSGPRTIGFIFVTEQVVKLFNNIDKDTRTQEYRFWTEHVPIAIKFSDRRVNPHHQARSYNSGTATKRQANMDVFTHVIVNVFDFQSDNPMEMEMTECGYDEIDNLAKIDKDGVMTLKYSKSSTDTTVPMKPNNKLLHLIWWRDYTVPLKPDKLMTTDECMKITQDDYEAFQYKQAANISISGEVKSVAPNKTTE